MNLHVYPSEPSVATRELLFAGFEGDFDENIRNFPYTHEVYRFAIENNTSKAIDWLEKRVEQLEVFQLPYAVICRLQWLKKDDFKLARLIVAHPFLRYVPVIALTEAGETADPIQLSRYGIDDCYSVPVEWDMLEDRLEFLNLYKGKMIDQAGLANTAHDLRYRIRPGKRIFDILAACVGIVLSLPLWLTIAIAIRLESKGPVIYKSKRVGSGYRVFDFLKFRSMYEDADQHLQELRHLNLYQHDTENAVFVKLAHDPRVTRVGRFIRKFSLDELPQFINVLRGDMSLVGNRPLPLYEAEMLVKEEYCERFLAPAGLTGLWQVTKRAHVEMSSEERIALDIAYSRNSSIWTDMSIIARTFGVIMQHENV